MTLGLGTRAASLATRGSGSELEIDEFSRWAEPLIRAIHRVVAIDVDNMMPAVTVLAFPWEPVVRAQVDFRLIAEITCFEAERSGQVVLEIQWAINDNFRCIVRCCSSLVESECVEVARTTISGAWILAFTLLAASCSDQTVPQHRADTKPQNERLHDAVSRLASDNAFSGVILVADQGQILLQRAFDHSGINQALAIEPDTKFAIASLTKSFTAVLALQVIESGLLSLDDVLQTQLPEYSASYSDQVTIRQLLQNRSGIPHYIDIPGWFDNDYKKSLTQETLLEAVAALPLKFKPGTNYHYSNMNFYLLGLIVEKVTGVSYEDGLKNRILAPLDLNSTGQIYESGLIENLAQNYLREDDGSLSPIPVTNPILFRATASQYSTSRDLYRWSTALRDETLLTNESKAILYDREAPMAWTVGAVSLDGDALLQVITYNGELIGYTSMITLLPDQNGVVIILNNNNAGYDALSTMTIEIASQLYGSQ
ncbi:MAG: serine hydrolase [Gammaproteobacteria bacterium]|nr:serine hydrolase [Gammaproteobacteria bacterium]